MNVQWPRDKATYKDDGDIDNLDPFADSDE